MSVTGAITLSSATAAAGRQVTATCTLTNGGTGAVTLVGIQPTVANSASAIALGLPPLGGANTMAIAGSSGTLKISWTVCPAAPASSYGLSEPASLAYSIGAYFQTSDGSAAAATPSTLTVSYAGN